MITYLITAIILYFVGLIVLGRLKKKIPDLYHSYERTQVTMYLAFCCFLWPVSISIWILIAAGFSIVYVSQKLLERLEK